ncbi:hypothetical protein HPB47_017087 [Ixodes persulcatus]|uniref:Uncharacterized protein n=1 Tax=Ixodes persulcatus TaxID=34615 RepID=A0AC60QRS8_IXOPE|nr:hypothetical protein HPB47_017087 [Ixodes persulcatus]
MLLFSALVGVTPTQGPLQDKVETLGRNHTGRSPSFPLSCLSRAVLYHIDTDSIPQAVLVVMGACVLNNQCKTEKDRLTEFLDPNVEYDPNCAFHNPLPVSITLNRLPSFCVFTKNTENNTTRFRPLAPVTDALETAVVPKKCKRRVRPVVVPKVDKASHRIKKVAERHQVPVLFSASRN